MDGVMSVLVNRQDIRENTIWNTLLTHENVIENIDNDSAIIQAGNAGIVYTWSAHMCKFTIGFGGTVLALIATTIGLSVADLLFGILVLSTHAPIFAILSVSGFIIAIAAASSFAIWDWDNEMKVIYAKQTVRAKNINGSLINRRIDIWDFKDYITNTASIGDFVLLLTPANRVLYLYRHAKKSVKQGTLDSPTIADNYHELELELCMLIGWYHWKKVHSFATEILKCEQRVLICTKDGWMSTHGTGKPNKINSVKYEYGGATRFQRITRFPTRNMFEMQLCKTTVIPYNILRVSVGLNNGWCWRLLFGNTIDKPEGDWMSETVCINSHTIDECCMWPYVDASYAQIVALIHGYSAVPTNRKAVIRDTFVKQNNVRYLLGHIIKIHDYEDKHLIKYQKKVEVVCYYPADNLWTTPVPWGTGSVHTPVIANDNRPPISILTYLSNLWNNTNRHHIDNKNKLIMYIYRQLNSECVSAVVSSTATICSTTEDNVVEIVYELVMTIYEVYPKTDMTVQAIQTTILSVFIYLCATPMLSNHTIESRVIKDCLEFANNIGINLYDIYGLIHADYNINEQVADETGFLLSVPNAPGISNMHKFEWVARLRALSSQHTLI